MSNIRTTLIGIAILGSLSALPTTSFALGTAEQRAACMGDVFTHCAAYIPNENKIAACLIAKRHQLSPGCQAQFK
jgi:hypothetical protein